MMEQIVSNAYFVPAAAVVIAALVIWLLHRYNTAIGAFADTLKQLLAIAESIFGASYPQVFAVINAVAYSIELSQDGITEQEAVDAATTLIQETLAGQNMSETEIKIAAHIAVFIANALNKIPQVQVERVMREFSPD
jgi:hypothetical protein